MVKLNLPSFDLSRLVPRNLGRLGEILERVKQRLPEATDIKLFLRTLRIPEELLERLPDRNLAAVLGGGLTGVAVLIGVVVWLMSSDEIITPPKIVETVADQGSVSVNLPMPPRAGQKVESLLTPPGMTGGDAPKAQASSPAGKEDQTSATMEAPGEATKVEEPPPPSLPPKPGRQRSNFIAGGEAAFPGYLSKDPPAAPIFANLPRFEPPNKKDKDKKDAPPVVVSSAPIPTLQQKTEQGWFLPVVAPDGMEAWRAYSRAFDFNDKRPRIGVLITGLGMSRDATEAAINKLQPEFTLSFSPYGEGLEDYMKKAKGAGHEVMLGLPMEPNGYPQVDSGPNSLLSFLDPLENTRRLESFMGKMTGYVGMNVMMGTKLVKNNEQMLVLLRNFKDRGLLLVDNGLSEQTTIPDAASTLGLPFAIADVVADDKGFRGSIDARLAKAEQIAREKGQALIIISPKPVSYERLIAWGKELNERGFVLAPVSALVKIEKKS